MLYNSVIFITIFLPIALGGWFLLNKLPNRTYAKVFIVGMSLWFYAYYNLYYLWILLASIALNYGLSFLMERLKDKGHGLRKALWITGLLGNVGMLFYFKYLNFFIDNCNFFFHSDIHIEKIALPLGISFFTFQQISFLTDRYTGEAKHYAPADYAFYVTFFPQLVAGPIVRHDTFIPQLSSERSGRISADDLYRGISLFTLGLAKKVLLADYMGTLVNAEYNNIPWLDTPSAWCVICFYMMELYFDFSGYSDMSRGIGRMFGIDIPKNFNSPFKSDSVKDFWRRWHITLGGFLTKYIYIPLGGNRKGRTRQCINLFIVFMVSGIWHGANWTFIVWGLMHALAVVFETAFPKVRFKKGWINSIITSLYVTLSFSVFRADSLSDAAQLWRKLFGFDFRNCFPGMCNTLAFPENYAVRKLLEMTAPGLVNPMFIGTFLVLALTGILAICGKQGEEWIEKKGDTRTFRFIIATLFVWAFISLSRVSVFLYFNF